jgi:ERCC4-related helicase
MTKIKIEKSMVYLNNLVKDAEKFLSPDIQPVIAEIKDAYFKQNGQDVYVVEGFTRYMQNRNNLSLSKKEEEFMHNKFSNINLYLLLKDTQSGRYDTVLLKDVEEIADYLYDNASSQMASSSKNKKNTNAKDAKNEVDLDMQRAYQLRDSCIPLISSKVYIRRQIVNGQDIIGISKNYELNK